MEGNLMPLWVIISYIVAGIIFSIGIGLIILGIKEGRNP
jgi:hypothetical protein